MAACLGNLTVPSFRASREMSLPPLPSHLHRAHAARRTHARAKARSLSTAPEGRGE